MSDKQPMTEMDDQFEETPPGTEHDQDEPSVPQPRPTPPLPDCVTHLSFFDKELYLVGTAHVSEKSVTEVRDVITALQPDTICLELCWKRYQAMRHDDGTPADIPLKELIFSRRVFFNLAQIILLLFYKSIGKKFEIEPGAEMKAAIREGDKIDAWLIPVDRDVDTTLNRAWNCLTWKDKITLLGRTVWYFLGGYGLSHETVEDMKKPDKLEEIVDAFAKTYPKLKACMIDERDEHIAEELLSCSGDTVVAILGAGHVPGITQRLKAMYEEKEEEYRAYQQETAEPDYPYEDDASANFRFATTQRDHHEGHEEHEE